MTRAEALAMQEEAYRKLRVAIGRRYGVAQARKDYQRATALVLKAERRTSRRKAA